MTPPRPYNNETRRLQQAELRERIAEAAAALHKQQGVLATSWANIAQAAGVSLPTVYKHYPTMEELIFACTGHAQAQAPAFPQEALLAAPDLPAAASVLAEGCDRQNAYFEPWLAWREEERVPALKQFLRGEREQLLATCRAVLEAHGVQDAAPIAAVWQTLLGFDFWHRLLREHGFTRAAVRQRQTHLLLAAVGPQPATPSVPRPNRKQTP